MPGPPQDPYSPPASNVDGRGPYLYRDLTEGLRSWRIMVVSGACAVLSILGINIAGAGFWGGLFLATQTLAWFSCFASSIVYFATVRHRRWLQHGVALVGLLASGLWVLLAIYATVALSLW